MKAVIPVFCTICGELRAEDDGWFMLTENQWTDRLKILGWNDALAGYPGVHAACGAAHVQQMVVHWMTTGSLEYPMARVPESSDMRRKGRSTAPPAAEPDIRCAEVVGELAVHRESLSRVLRENPESLIGILEALVTALPGYARPVEGQPEEEEESESYALTEV